MDSLDHMLARLPTDVARHFDEVIFRFEEDWSTGRRREITCYLTDVLPELRDYLAKEMILVEIDRLISAGAVPSWDNYRWLFPGLSQTIDEQQRQYEHSAADSPDGVFAGASESRASGQHFDGIGIIGPYSLLQLRGAGGMGTVFLARSTEDKQIVALKMMKREFAADPLVRKRFFREAELLSQVSSEHVVRVLHVAVDAPVPYFAMEALQGQTLRERVKDCGVLTPRQVCRLGRETALGLAAAHKQGVIHRDIKPDNVWLTHPTDQVKLLDFGLARPEAVTQKLTRTGIVVGTLGYVAPEVLSGARADARSDLFGLGQLMNYAMHGALRPSTRLPAKHETSPLADKLLNWIERLTAVSPSERPESVVKVADALALLKIHSERAKIEHRPIPGTTFAEPGRP